MSCLSPAPTCFSHFFLLNDFSPLSRSLEKANMGLSCPHRISQALLVKMAFYYLYLFFLCVSVCFMNFYFISVHKNSFAQTESAKWITYLVFNMWHQLTYQFSLILPPVMEVEFLQLVHGSETYQNKWAGGHCRAQTWDLWILSLMQRASSVIQV